MLRRLRAFLAVPDQREETGCEGEGRSVACHEWAQAVRGQHTCAQGRGDQAQALQQTSRG
ncbi:hypothetical protein [Streptomyces sp. 1222.5]|uniref:hypothetical protein n=1 Tax=Streptomyces sp. 1222.5 TaxID=1881026 RepID=UPI003EBC8946